MMGIGHLWQVLGSIGGSTFKGNEGNEKETPSFSSKHILAQCCIATRQLQSEVERLRKSQAGTFVTVHLEDLENAICFAVIGMMFYGYVMLCIFKYYILDLLYYYINQLR